MPLDKAVAAQLHGSQQMVSRCCGRFVTQRLAGLVDDPRPRHPCESSDEQVEALIVKTMQNIPDRASHWSSSRQMTMAYEDLLESQFHCGSR